MQAFLQSLRSDSYRSISVGYSPEFIISRELSVALAQHLRRTSNLHELHVSLRYLHSLEYLKIILLASSECATLRCLVIDDGLSPIQAKQISSCLRSFTVIPNCSCLQLVFEPRTFSDAVATILYSGLEQSTRVVDILVKTTVHTSNLITVLPKFKRRLQGILRRNARSFLGTAAKPQQAQPDSTPTFPAGRTPPQEDSTPIYAKEINQPESGRPSHSKGIFSSASFDSANAAPPRAPVQDTPRILATVGESTTPSPHVPEPPPEPVRFGGDVSDCPRHSSLSSSMLRPGGCAAEHDRPSSSGAARDASDKVFHRQLILDIAGIKHELNHLSYVCHSITGDVSLLQKSIDHMGAEVAQELHFVRACAAEMIQQVATLAQAFAFPPPVASQPQCPRPPQRNHHSRVASPVAAAVPQPPTSRGRLPQPPTDARSGARRFR